MANPNIVSVSSIYAESVAWNLSNTLTTTLLTVSSDVVLKVNFIQCANVDGTSAADINLYVTKANFTPAGASNFDTSGSFYLAKTITVPADASIIILNSPLYLMEGDVLKGGASAASDLDLIISYEVINDA